MWFISTYKKVKAFIVKYWKALVALLLILIGYLFGRSSDTSKIDKADFVIYNEETTLEALVAEVETFYKTLKL